VKYRILHIILLYVLFQKVNRLFIVKKKIIIGVFDFLFRMETLRF
jgi:hypothetical protein